MRRKYSKCPLCYRRIDSGGEPFNLAFHLTDRYAQNSHDLANWGGSWRCRCGWVGKDWYAGYRAGVDLNWELGACQEVIDHIAGDAAHHAAIAGLLKMVKQ